MGKPIIALTIVTLTCAGSSLYLWQALRGAREDSARLQNQVAQLERSLAERAADMAPAPAPAATITREPPPALSSQRTPTTVAAAAELPAPIVRSMPVQADPMDPETRRRRIMESHEQQLRMLKDPQYRELMRTQQKMAMQRMYNDLEPLLGLTQDEADRLLEALAEQAIRSMEQRPSMLGSNGVAVDHAAISKQQQEYADLKRKNDAEIAQVLGPKFSEWQTYQSNGWSRSQVMRLRQTLSSSAEPLRQDQVKPLVDAIAYEQKQMGIGEPRNRANFGQFGSDPQAQIRRSEEWLERSAQSQQRIRDAVSGLLTPRQFEELQQQHAQELKMMELNVKQQRARAEAQARGELPADPAMGGWSPVTISTN